MYGYRKTCLCGYAAKTINTARTCACGFNDYDDDKKTVCSVAVLTCSPVLFVFGLRLTLQLFCREQTRKRKASYLVFVTCFGYERYWFDF